MYIVFDSFQNGPSSWISISLCAVQPKSDGVLMLDQHGRPQTPSPGLLHHQEHCGERGADLRLPDEQERGVRCQATTRQDPVPVWHQQLYRLCVLMEEHTNTHTRWTLTFYSRLFCNLCVHHSYTCKYQGCSILMNCFIIFVCVSKICDGNAEGRAIRAIVPSS